MGAALTKGGLRILGRQSSLAPSRIFACDKGRGVGVSALANNLGVKDSGVAREKRLLPAGGTAIAGIL